MYSAEILAIKNVRPHGNADKVLLATCQGNQVVVGLDTKEGDLGIYFPTDGQLSHEFCSANNLYRNSELNKDKQGPTGMFDDNRRVRTQKFRGEVSDGFWIPVKSLSFAGDVSSLKEHASLETFNGVPICNKYYSPSTIRAQKNNVKQAKKSRTSIMFKEHFDTEHLGKNLHKIPSFSNLVITEKVHGTSGRVGHVLIDRNLSKLERLLSYFGVPIQKQEWGYLNGSRRVVLEETKYSQGFHSKTIRDQAFSLFKDNLRKGETVYFEIVGYEDTSKPIMSSVNTKSLKDKEFTANYGEIMVFSYGCPIGISKVYVYRITLTTEDGHTVDYSWEDVKTRCKELGVGYVPELQVHRYVPFDGPNGTQKDHLMSIVEEFAKGPSLLDNSHIKEGVCVRVDGSGLHNQTYKHKSFEFKVLEGIVKDTAIVDIEEVS